MKLSLDNNTSRYTIKSYETGSVTINHEQHSTSLVVTRETLITPWGPEQLTELNQGHIESLIELQPEIILLGTGNILSFPHPSLISIAMQHGIGFEVMDTGSACRTFNVLSSEDRNVAAALIIDGE